MIFPFILTLKVTFFNWCLNLNVCGIGCTQPHYNDTNIYSLNAHNFLRSSIHRFWAKWCTFVQAPPTTVDGQCRFIIDPPEWALNSPRLFWRQRRYRQECLQSDWGFVVGCNNEHSSHNLFQTSETQWIAFVFKRMRPHLSKCIYVSWSSFTSWRSEYTFF